MHRQNIELLELLEPVVSAMGYKMLGIEYRRQKYGSILRLYIDDDSGVTLDDCARVSEQVIGILDVNDPIKEKYYLEVSSPGLNRPLFTLQQFQQFLGHKVKLKLNEKVDKRLKIIGIIKLIQGESIVIDEDNIDYIVPIDSIKLAYLVADI